MSATTIRRGPDEPKAPELRWLVPYPTILLFGVRPVVPYRRDWPDGEFHAPPITPDDASEPECGRPQIRQPWAKCPCCKGRIGRRLEASGWAVFDPADDPDVPPVRVRIWTDVVLCPECVDRFSERRIYCGRCDSSHPENERRLDLQRAATAREAADAKARQRAAESDRLSVASTREALNEALAARRQDRGTPRLTEAERRKLWNGYVRPFIAPAAEPSCLAKVCRDWLREIDQEPDWTIELDERGNAIRPEAADDESTEPVGNPPNVEPTSIPEST